MSTQTAGSLAAPPVRSAMTGRFITWGGLAIVLALAPLFFRSDFGITLLAQVMIAIVACLSYNMLLGQGGMLSFGHAVYSGLGTFVAPYVTVAPTLEQFAAQVAAEAIAQGIDPRELARALYAGSSPRDPFSETLDQELTRKPRTAEEERSAGRKSAGHAIHDRRPGHEIVR